MTSTSSGTPPPSVPRRLYAGLQGWATNWRRLRVALFHPAGAQSTRDRADFLLFAIGLLVEYLLLLVLFRQYAEQSELALREWIVTAALFVALGTHQFLIFRNSFIQYGVRTAHVRPLELTICLSFGVLTGELGYFLVLAIAFQPDWLIRPPMVAGLAAAFVAFVLIVIALLPWSRPGQPKMSRRFLVIAALSMGIAGALWWQLSSSRFAIRTSTEGLDWIFAKDSLVITASNVQGVADGGGLALDAIKWFVHSLGRGLEAVFASGAFLLSVLILLWDFSAGASFHRSAAAPVDVEADRQIRLRSYKSVRYFFFTMDLMAALTWLAILGVVLPNGLKMSSKWWFDTLQAVGFVYFGAAIWRLIYAHLTLKALSSDEAAMSTVV